MIKVDAFSYVEHGTAAGKVQWISENAFWVNEQTNQAQDPYYKVGVSIDAMNFINVPENFRLVPGMTLTADIKVGRRSLGAYLLGRLRQGFEPIDARAMIQPSRLIPGRAQALANSLSRPWLKARAERAFTDQSYHTALRLWLKCVGAGDGESAYHIGELYENGLGVAGIRSRRRPGIGAPRRGAMRRRSFGWAASR